MRGQVRLDEILGTHVRVDLRCGYAGMAKQLLYGTHIRTALNQMRCEGMAQGMRMQRFGDVRTFTGGSDDFPHRLSGQSFAALVEEHRPVLGCSFGLGLQGGPSESEISAQSLAREAAYRYQTLFGALAHQTRHLIVQIDVVQIDAACFGDP